VELPEEAVDPRQKKALLNRVQKIIQKQALRFIPAVLHQQQIEFASSDLKMSRCQKIKWDQAISLFYQGYQAQMKTKELLEHPMNAIDAQREAIDLWKKVIQLLSNSAGGGGESEMNEQSEKETSDLLRTIQEMQSEDQPGKPSLDQEWHAW
jgi:hypothetical protein